MKARKQFFFLIASFFLILSCKDSQMKEVMAIHDEVMPKMSVLGKMVGEITAKEDSTALGLQYKNARIDLQEAHKSMMDWMQGFGNRFDSDEILNGKKLSTQKQNWLDEEEEKVKALRDQINSSIEEAKKLLDKS
jgi:outer membrane translocation and assembly module TamA